MGPPAAEGPSREKILGFEVPKHPKSLKKSRAARAQVCLTNHRCQDLTVGNGKSEDHAKMTYSFIDFWSRHGVKRNPGAAQDAKRWDRRSWTCSLNGGSALYFTRSQKKAWAYVNTTFSHLLLLVRK